MGFTNVLRKNKIMRLAGEEEVKEEVRLESWRMAL